MKYSQIIGVVMAIVLAGSCFFPWTWYPDLGEFFNGFYSADNNYGRPGRVFMVLTAIAIIFFVIPRVWAKRWNLLVCGLTLAYAIKTFILFTSCYRGICPVKQPAVWVMLFSSVLMLVFALLPDLKTSRGVQSPSNSE